MNTTTSKLLVAAATAVLLPLTSIPAFAGEADVIKAVAKSAGDGKFRFDVTIKSNDKNWDYYCDRFDILGPDGKILGTRILHHPHETEQPFTRSLGSVAIDPSITEVTVTATMKPSGEGGETMKIKLPGR